MPRQFSGVPVAICWKASTRTGLSQGLKHKTIAKFQQILNSSPEGSSGNWSENATQVPIINGVSQAVVECYYQSRSSGIGG